MEHISSAYLFIGMTFNSLVGPLLFVHNNKTTFHASGYNRCGFLETAAFPGPSCCYLRPAIGLKAVRIMHGLERMKLIDKAVEGDGLGESENKNKNYIGGETFPTSIKERGPH
eukprot:1137071-Pelagomonas_calceolata.AAC.1